MKESAALLQLSKILRHLELTDEQRRQDPFLPYVWVEMIELDRPDEELLRQADNAWKTAFEGVAELGGDNSSGWRVEGPYPSDRGWLAVLVCAHAGGEIEDAPGSIPFTATS